MSSYTPEKGMKIYTTENHPHREPGSLVGTVTEVYTTTMTFKHATDLRVDSMLWFLDGEKNKMYEWRK